MSALTAFMARIGALTLMAAMCGFALPNGSLGKSARKAISLMILACMAQSVMELIGGFGV